MASTNSITTCTRPREPMFAIATREHAFSGLIGPDEDGTMVLERLARAIRMHERALGKYECELDWDSFFRHGLRIFVKSAYAPTPLTPLLGGTLLPDVTDEVIQKLGFVTLRSVEEVTKYFA